MKTYPIPMVPGPVKVPAKIFNAYQTNFGSADLEEDFVDLYDQVEMGLQQIMGTRNAIAILSGEGMLALWAALKSCLVAGDRVLSIVTGVFGDGIADMAASVGADVSRIQLDYNQTISDLAAIEKAVEDFKPKMITAVHCETPSGTLNPLEGVGCIKRAYNVPLFYVDAVASIGGTEVLTDDWEIDLCLGASQKCLSSVPDIAFVSVSDTAWDRIDQVNYVGYESLKPFRSAREDMYFPYTPNWHAMAGLDTAVKLVLGEGLDACYKRHEQVAAHCRKHLKELGLSLYPAADAVPSPTVTAANVPIEISWEAFDDQLRQGGLVTGGSFGPLAGKVFRFGHMGSQADMKLLTRALDVLKEVLSMGSNREDRWHRQQLL